VLLIIIGASSLFRQGLPGHPKVEKVYCKPFLGLNATNNRDWHKVKVDLVRLYCCCECPKDLEPSKEPTAKHAGFCTSAAPVIAMVPRRYPALLAKNLPNMEHPLGS
jgi:hypothetical protein